MPTNEGEAGFVFGQAPAINAIDMEGDGWHATNGPIDRLDEIAQQDRLTPRHGAGAGLGMRYINTVNDIGPVTNRNHWGTALETVHNAMGASAALDYRTQAQQLNEMEAMLKQILDILQKKNQPAETDFSF